MASFRTGFKIFGEISLKQGLGRIRSFSEDRKPGHWLPEDQWAVRQPGCTCNEKSEKAKPPKASKSWLSICKEPHETTHLECDIRHNNCPPPPVVKEGPWYSLDNLLPKKKPPEKPPPLCSCREEMKRCADKDEVGEKELHCPFVSKKEPKITCTPKSDPCPAPVVSLSSPLPKELDIMLWCGKPSKDTTRIAAKCFSDRLPFQEFRPQKMWKPPPFQIPIKNETCSRPSSFYCSGPVAYSEYKQVELPRPLYTRYKSVELKDKNFLLCMTAATCPDAPKDVTPKPAQIPPSCCAKPSKPCKSSKPLKPCFDFMKESCRERDFLEAASCKPVRIKKAPKYCFRPKPTKLVEKKVLNHLLHKCSDLNFRPPGEKTDESECETEKSVPRKIEPTKTESKEKSESYEKDFILPCGPPSWMNVLNKSGPDKCSEKSELPKEPDWCSETDGLKFYDGQNKGLIPKPPPDPYLALCSKTQTKDTKSAELKQPCDNVKEPGSDKKNKFVLMPEKYNIKKSESRTSQKSKEEKEDKCAKDSKDSKESKESKESKDSQDSKESKESKDSKDSNESKESKDSKDSNESKESKDSKDSKDSKESNDSKDSKEFEKFIQTNTPQTINQKHVQPMKENILYDLQRLCPNTVIDPTKITAPCRKARDTECQPPTNFYRRYSTFSSSKLLDVADLQVQKTQWRTECGDRFGRCKVRPPKRRTQKDCIDKKAQLPHCSEIQLPCCPKARCPPQCNLRRPPPPCRKKLPPKPSFSECTKDPLPCPRLTECNCWDKKPGKNGH